MGATIAAHQRGNSNSLRRHRAEEINAGKNKQKFAARLAVVQKQIANAGFNGLQKSASAAYIVSERFDYGRKL